MMERDIRGSSRYVEIKSLIEALRQPGTGQISDASEVNVSPDGKYAVFAATIVDDFDGAPPTRIGLIDLISGATRVMTFGPETDRLPRYSPDGARVAFLSDRKKAGDFQLYLLDPVSGAARPTPRVPGGVEY
jgi:Tol biopolymer transport system component